MGKGRRLVRALLVEVIYRNQLSGERPEDVLRDVSERRELTEEQRWFLRALVDTYAKERERILSLMERASVRWPLDRMLPLDRAIIAAGVAEMLLGETPYQVAISEAVELAKMYSTENSKSFVNGVLDGIAGLLGLKREASL